MRVLMMATYHIIIIIVKIVYKERDIYALLRGCALAVAQGLLRGSA